MPRDCDDSAYLWDMLEAATTVMEFSGGRTYDDYLQDQMLRAAVERMIEIIGEAARNVSDAFKAAHPEVPWRIIIAQRNVLAHDYGDISHERIWRVVTTHVPTLIAQLKLITPPRAE
jgi:uncharacterized protein with HEPN domain